MTRAPAVAAGTEGDEPAPEPGRPPGHDWTLWRQARAGDEGSASELVRLLMPQALGLARQLLERTEDAEDAVQESFVRLWRSSPADDRSSRLATYFNAIVINRCRTRLTARIDVPVDDETLAMLQEAKHDAHADGHPMARLSAGSTARHLIDALDGLPRHQRMAIAMWAYTDATVNDIAAALGRDPNAAHQLLHRARRALRAAWERKQS